jgi:hypothetical protein
LSSGPGVRSPGPPPPGSAESRASVQLGTVPKRGPSEAPRGFPRKRFFLITAYDRLKFYEDFAKTIFRSREQSYTVADSKSAQICKYRAFQVPPTQERPMTLADCDLDGRQIAPSRAHRAPWPGDTRYRLVSVSSVMLCVRIQSPTLRGSGLSAALRAVIQQALSAKSGGRIGSSMGATAPARRECAGAGLAPRASCPSEL